MSIKQKIIHQLTVAVTGPLGFMSNHIAAYQAFHETVKCIESMSLLQFGTEGLIIPKVTYCHPWGYKKWVLGVQITLYLVILTSHIVMRQGDYQYSGHVQCLVIW